MIEDFPINNGTNVQEEVWKTVLEYTNLIIEGKIEEFLKYIHEDYSGWNNIEPFPADRQSIVNEVNSATSSIPSGKYKIIPIRLNIHSGLAIVHYYLGRQSKINEINIDSNIAHYTDILIKGTSGWQLIADHFGFHTKFNTNNLDLKIDC